MPAPPGAPGTFSRDRYDPAGRPEHAGDDARSLAVLGESVIVATGAGSLLSLALAPDLLQPVPERPRAALRLRLGLDRIAAGEARRARSLQEVGDEIGASPGEVADLLGEALRALGPGAGDR